VTSITTEIYLPDAPPIEGLRFRSVDLAADAAALAAVINATAAFDRREFALSPEDVRHDLEHQANFDLDLDVLVAEIDGRIIGEAERYVVIRESAAVHQWDAFVHPDYRGRGIGRVFAHWVERRAFEVAAAWPDTEPHQLGAWVDTNVPGGIRLLESEGYHRTRYGFTMLRPLSEPIPDAPLPNGLEVRPVVAADHRRIWAADSEAFRDHADAAIRTDEDFERWFTMPNIDTDLWRVAWADDEVAGSVMTFIWPDENEQMGLNRGWLEHISVRRPWRKRGLATALIADAMRGLRDTGIDEAILGVDAKNPTGALQLYESLGFRRHRTGIGFRKAI